MANEKGTKSLMELSIEVFRLANELEAFLVEESGTESAPEMKNPFARVNDRLYYTKQALEKVLATVHKELAEPEAPRQRKVD